MWRFLHMGSVLLWNQWFCLYGWYVVTWYNATQKWPSWWFLVKKCQLSNFQYYAYLGTLSAPLSALALRTKIVHLHLYFLLYILAQIFFPIAKIIYKPYSNTLWPLFAQGTKFLVYLYLFVHFHSTFYAPIFFPCIKSSAQ